MCRDQLKLVFSEMTDFEDSSYLCWNLTIFEKHKHDCSQSHISYSLKDDTWLIASDYIDNETEEYCWVNSLASLKKAFEKIKIAKGDELFIGEKKILPDPPKISSTIN